MVFLLHYLFLFGGCTLKEPCCRFVKVEKIKDQLLQCNKETCWVPDFVKVFYGFMLLSPDSAMRRKPCMEKRCAQALFIALNRILRPTLEFRWP
jgi:hypothetical protein